MARAVRYEITFRSRRQSIRVGDVVFAQDARVAIPQTATTSPSTM